MHRSPKCTVDCQSAATLCGHSSQRISPALLWPPTPRLNDPRKTCHSSRILCKLVELPNHCIDFFSRRKTVLEDCIRDALHGNRIHEFHLALCPNRLNDHHFHILEAPVRKEYRQPGPYVWIAAS